MLNGIVFAVVTKAGEAGETTS